VNRRYTSTAATPPREPPLHLYRRNPTPPTAATPP